MLDVFTALSSLWYLSFCQGRYHRSGYGANLRGARSVYCCSREEGEINSIASAIVIPQTTLEECRNRSLVMYRHVTDFCEP